MSGQTAEKLAYMANQIARNMALDDHPAVAVADHITAYWTPAMIEMLLTQADAGLHPLAAEAMARIAKEHIPAPQV